MAAPKNVLLVVADDLGKSLGCYGETAIRTPHIDALAKDGTVFDNAFASTASCSGSRSVIYTGLHTHENGQYGLNHYTHHFMTFDHIPTAPKLLRDHGYLTGIVGKIHVGPLSVYPWEVVRESPTRDVTWVAEQVDSFLQQAKQEQNPFFLAVGYMDPHRDSTRGGFGNGDDQVAAEDPEYQPENVKVPEFLSDIPEVRQELAEYYRSIGRVDRGLGLLIDSLEKHEFDDNTLVIFMSDNGPPFLNSKTTLYDAGIRLPLIIRQPNGPKNVFNPNLISFVDILPTILDWTGYLENTNVPSRRKGRSLLPILSATSVADKSWTKVFGSHTFHEITNYYPTRFLRTSRYKYHRNVAWKLDFPFSTDLYASLSWEGIRNHGEQVKIGSRPLKSYIQRPPEELYDMQEDPREVTNLASDPEYKDLLRDLRRQLEQWQRDTQDPWLVRDGVSLHEMQGHIDAGLKIPDRFDFDVHAPGSRT
ncbi:alkaline phosphatase-like protein [Xylona heveae TC161]|uniref:Alkaline phosphatase-like protein n=1 Tax=Xylona heveae (strain CBS 132557 / TC161) TaxID=1328760 RepID=A0A165HT92_XYLHT|nr:alkaline phosphatase-like protein [Xylona heveae TC161]KZF23904.1 alkaline phosphatase-like protein [Xylona heveae TC161]